MLDREGRNGDEGRNCKGVRMGEVRTLRREEAISKLGRWTHHQPGLWAGHAPLCRDPVVPPSINPVAAFRRAEAS